MKAILASLIVACLGCQTAFTGSAHIDPATCQTKCTGAGLQMTGMVYMGEYSSACICERPGAPGSAPPAAGAAAAAATTGVVMQMRQTWAAQAQ